MKCRSDVERAQISGSSKKFFTDMAQFLDDNTAYKRAVGFGGERATHAISEALVSVVLPFEDEVGPALNSAYSALCQSHANLELIMVHAGSSELSCAIKSLMRVDMRVTVIAGGALALGAARERGLDAARGSYISFLSAGDTFMPHKIERQLTAMQNSGHLMSHTSYILASQDGLVSSNSNSGELSGKVYPAIIEDCPIVAGTVMLHRLLVAEGFAFSRYGSLGQDILPWIWIAQRHDILGIQEPLSIIAPSKANDAAGWKGSVESLQYVIEQLRSDPVHSRHGPSIRALETLRAHLVAASAAGEKHGASCVPGGAKAQRELDH
jgi:hypothetical protein